MKTNQHNLVARTKKLMASSFLLLLFLAPLFVSLNWLKDAFMQRDPRKVYATSEVMKFGENCSTRDKTIAPFDEPLITITFDDGWESVYSSGLEKLEKYCLKSTQYILGDHFSEYGYLSKSQVRSLYENGHEIASHTMTHPDLTSLPEGTLVWELTESRRLLSQEFGSVKDIASPLGATNQQVRDRIKQTYRSHRNTASDPAVIGDEDINVKDKFDIYQINAYTIRNTTTIEDIQKLIEYTIKRKGWLVLNWHQVDKSNAHYAVTPEVLEEQLRLVHESGVKTPTMGQVLDKISARRER